MSLKVKAVSHVCFNGNISQTVRDHLYRQNDNDEMQCIRTDLNKDLNTDNRKMELVSVVDVRSAVSRLKAHKSDG